VGDLGQGGANGVKSHPKWTPEMKKENSSGPEASKPTFVMPQLGFCQCASGEKNLQDFSIGKNCNVFFT